MASFPAFLSPGGAAITSDNGRTDELLNWDEHWRQRETYGVQQMPVAGAYAFNLPIAQQENNSASSLAHSFKPDYYERVHVIPGRIDLGNLIAAQTHDVEVWNAHTTGGKLLSEIQELDTESITYSGQPAAPTTFGLLESRVYQFEIAEAGPVSTEAVFTFVFPGETPDLTFTATRVVVWPFHPHWRAPLVERLAWLTDVLEAADATEQRRALRSIPRRAFSYPLLAAGADRQHLDALLWEWQGRLFALPLWTDEGRLTAGASAGANSLSLDTTQMGYDAGGYAVLWASTLQTEAVEIASVAAGGLTLADPLRADWPAGTRIYPARLARLQDAQTLTSYTDAVAEAAVSFEVAADGDVTAVDSTASYRGLPVLDQAPNWRDDIGDEYRRLLQRVDNRTGVVGVTDLRNRTTPLQDYLWTLGSREDIGALRAWLHARQGRLNAIWVPSFKADLMLVQSVVAGQDFINIAAIAYARFLRDAIGRRDILIQLHDGSRLYRRIDDASVVDSSTEQLALDSALGQDFGPADVQRISFLQLCRLESDTVELAWHSTQVMECRHLVRGLADDV